MTAYLFVTLGLVIKSLQVTLKDFSKKDLIEISVGLLIGLLAAGKIAEDYQAGDFLHPGIGLIGGYSFVIAFAFREKICPKVGEALVLLYGLFGAYLIGGLLLTHKLPSLVFNASVLFLCLYLGMVLVTVITRSRISKTAQVAHMILFLMMSVFIGGWLLWNGSVQLDNWLSLILVGYGSLALISSIHYLLYLLPYKGRHQTMAERNQNIKEHLYFLENKYLDIDLSWTNLLIVAILFGTVVALDIYTEINTALLVTIGITLGHYLSTYTLNHSYFTPKSVL